MIIETPRLLLRHFRASDEPFLAELLGDPEVMRFSLGVKTPDQIKRWLEDRLSSQRQNPVVFLAAVLVKDSRQFIGYCGLLDYEDLDGAAETEIGYRLIRSAWGQGYATEAAMAVRNHGFQEVGRERLVALIDPENSASIAVAKKIGMQFEKEIMMDGYTYPDHLYTIERKR